MNKLGRRAGSWQNLSYYDLRHIFLTGSTSNKRFTTVMGISIHPPTLVTLCKYTSFQNAQFGPCLFST